MYYYRGRFQEAYEAYKKANDLSPEILFSLQATEYPITILMAKGPGAALNFLKSEKLEHARLAGGAIAYLMNGNAAESDALLSELIKKYAGQFDYEIAQVYAFRKDHLKAIEWLNRAYLQKEFLMLLVDKDPVFKSVRDEPKFQEIVAKLNIQK